MVKKDDIQEASECDRSCKGIDVPTEDEMVALNAMRAIKNHVRDLNKRLSEISSSGRDEDIEEILNLEREIAQLKVEWNEWEEKREKAAKERMFLLGHEKRPS